MLHESVFRLICGLKQFINMINLFAVSAGLALLPNPALNLRNLILIPVLSLVCIVMEAFSPHGWDNATMPFIPLFFVSSFF
jgi:hypothetical protein